MLDVLAIMAFIGMKAYKFHPDKNFLQKITFRSKVC